MILLMLTRDSRVSNMKFGRLGTSDKQDRLDGKHKNCAQGLLK